MPIDVHSGNKTLERLVEASGLAPILARGTITRCCTRLGIRPEDVTARDIPKLAPLIREAMRLYLTGAELDEHLAALDALSRS